MLKATPALGLTEDALTENCVADGGGGALLPHALRKPKLQIMIRYPRDFFMTLSTL
jgi:hypothetical protein